MVGTKERIHLQPVRKQADGATDVRGKDRSQAPFVGSLGQGHGGFKVMAALVFQAIVQDDKRRFQWVATFDVGITHGAA